MKRIEASVNTSSKKAAMVQMKPATHFSSREKLRTQESQMLPFKRKKKRQKKNNAFNSKLSPKEQTVKKNLLAILSDYSDNNTTDDEDTASYLEQQNLENLSSDHNGNYEEKLPPTAGSSFNHTSVSPSEEPGTRAVMGNYSSFTPNLHFVRKCKDTILRVGGEELSIVHLKSLELDLSPEEVQCCQQTYHDFRKGQLMSAVIDAFLFKLSENFISACVASTKVAAVLADGHGTDDLFQVPTGCKVVLFPANVFNHWIVIAFLIDKEVVLYFDPLNQSIVGFRQKVLSNATVAMRKFFPSITKWVVKIMKHDKQEDKISSGVNVSFFAQQVLMQCTSFTPLQDCLEYRKFMYNLLVGSCLRRQKFGEHSICLACEKDTSDDPAVACMNCDQWFHLTCLPSSPELHFICPSLSRA
jgi:hypothetical protein